MVQHTFSASVKILLSNLSTHSLLTGSVLNILFTHPDYRRKGIGAMLVKWGSEQAKHRGVEFWLNATPVGKPLYEKLGFQLVERNPLVPKTDNPDDVWRATEREFADVVFWTMYLPATSSTP